VDPEELIQFMTNKSLKLRLEHLRVLEPMTKAQRQVFDNYEKGNNVVMSGSAGSGKTFLAMALGLEDVLDKETPYEKVVIVRSAVPTRDMGFLPGDKDEKEDVYLAPYKAICTELFDDSDAWNKLIMQGAIEFLTTSYIRGITLNDSIVIVDEMQNLNFHELDSVITRVGQHCKFIMSGDYYQSDFHKDGDKNGILQFLEILRGMSYFSEIQFGWEDIVRSDLVREYIMTKEQMGIR